MIAKAVLVSRKLSVARWFPKACGALLGVQYSRRGLFSFVVAAAMETEATDGGPNRREEGRGGGVCVVEKGILRTQYGDLVWRSSAARREVENL